ncbi:O-antigen ligase family protein [Vibrio vulnificus]|uniref:O-antigen ligase family protein n=1 Tax=Vibrio vulnificus TaxID=672 RepID=UPI001CDBBFD7|nr:O-antigen ligase family protein [Vibrio vulnificus]ELQ2337884.1 O-antigen ligase family protein [Vibrio vulnificus]ELQ2466258.1 O-antigen ligase family protein [Vibrio vulnificus]MCA3953712.1 O-antigen ligase family protein [Vibrio vulnificus]
MAITKNKQSELLSSIACSLPIIFVFSGFFLYGDASKDFVIVSLISVLFLQIMKLRTERTLFVNKDCLSLLLLATLGYAIFAKNYHGLSSSWLRTVASLFLVVSFIPRKYFNLHYFFHLTQLASLVIFFYALTTESRWDWPMNPIPYSTMIAVLLCFSLYYTTTKHRWVQKMASITLISNSYLLVYSETRGTLLAVIVCILFLFIRLKDISWPRRILGPTIFIVSFSIFSLTNNTLIEKIRTMADIKPTAVEVNDFNTLSRLQLWQASLDIIPQSVLIGHGKEFSPLLEQIVIEKNLNPSIINLSHFHNQIISTLVEGGVLGFTLIAMIFLYPFFKRDSVASDEKNMLYIIMCIYFISGLTDVPLSHSATFSFYLLTTTLLTHGCYEHKNHQFTSL